MDGYAFPNESEFQWSILIVLYPFVTGLVAGAFVVSSLYHVFGMKSLRPVARLALVTALAFLLIAPLPLQAHLGHPERAFLIFLTPNFTSAMAGFGYIWMAYLILVVVETWLVFRPDIVALAQRSRWPLSAVYRSMALGVDDVSEEALAVDHTLIRVLAAVGIPAAGLLHGYVGFIFGAIKANPWWSTPLMPIIFLLSAIVSGIALLIVMYVVAMKLLEREIDHDCVRAMAGLLAAFLFIDLALEGLEILSMAYEQEESWDVVSGLMERIFVSFVIVQIVLGALIPLFALGYVSLIPVGRRLSTAITTIAGVMVVIGVFAMRWNVVVGGQTISKSLRGYVEYEWIFGGREGVFMAALVLCLPIVAFIVLAALLPPWVAAEDEEADIARAPVGHSGLTLRPVGVGTAPGERGAYYLGTVDKPHRKRYVGLKLAFLALATTMGVLMFGILTVPGKPGLLELPGKSPPPVLIPQYRVTYPAELVARFTEPAGASWVEPLDVATLGDRVFVLDHNGEQVVEIDQQGTFVQSFNSRTVAGLDIHHPHAMVSDGTYLYIGNTFPPRVYQLEPRAGLLKRSIVLPPGVEELPSVPTGMAVTPEGNVIVADGQNHRLILLTPDGLLSQVINRPSGSWDLFLPGNINIAPETATAKVGPIATTGRPGSVGVTADGTILAVDILGPGIVRVNRDGTLGTSFARPSDPIGGTYDPTDIVVDAGGRIYVADELIGGIQVYTPEGEPLGIIGRGDPNSFIEPSELTRPSSLALLGDMLYVIDRGRGVVVFQLPGAATGQTP